MNAKKTELVGNFRNAGRKWSRRAEEVEPDVMLYAQMNVNWKEPLLAQLIQVTPTSLNPIPR